MASLAGISHLSSEWSSGYLNAGEHVGLKVYLHYVFVRTTDKHETSATPLVWLMNGRSGVSSMYHLLMQVGPHVVTSKNGWKFRENSLSWATRAHLLLIDFPAPVGFSYCAKHRDDIEANRTLASCGEWDDITITKHNQLALDDFFAKNPRYLRNPFFLVGKSYAGIYVSVPRTRLFSITN